MTTIQRVLFAFMAGLLSASFAYAEGQGEVSTDGGTYPERGITLIVTANAGGGTDAMARAVATPLEQRLGVPMTVVNNGQANGLAGMTEIARAAPDGYTLGVFSNTDVAHFVNTIEDIQFGTDDFTYIAALNATSDVLILSQESRFSTLDEMLDYARANPGGVTVALPSSIQRLSLAVLNTAFDVTLSGVVYEGGGSVFAAISGTQVDAGILSARFIDQSEDQGLSVLGVMLNERLETYPDVPTFSEQGYPAATNAASRMLVGPAGLPQDVIGVLTRELTAGYQAEIRESVLGINEAPVFRDHENVNTFLDFDFAQRRAMYGVLATE